MISSSAVITGAPAQQNSRKPDPAPTLSSPSTTMMQRKLAGTPDDKSTFGDDDLQPTPKSISPTSPESKEATIKKINLSANPKIYIQTKDELPVFKEPTYILTNNNEIFFKYGPKDIPFAIPADVKVVERLRKSSPSNPFESDSLLLQIKDATGFEPFHFSNIREAIDLLKKLKGSLGETTLDYDVILGKDILSYRNGILPRGRHADMLTEEGAMLHAAGEHISLANGTSGYIDFPALPPASVEVTTSVNYAAWVIAAFGATKAFTGNTAFLRDPWIVKNLFDLNNTWVNLLSVVFSTPAAIFYQASTSTLLQKFINAIGAPDPRKLEQMELMLIGNPAELVDQLKDFKNKTGYTDQEWFVKLSMGTGNGLGQFGMVLKSFPGQLDYPGLKEVILLMLFLVNFFVGTDKADQLIREVQSFVHNRGGKDEILEGESDLLRSAFNSLYQIIFLYIEKNFLEKIKNFFKDEKNDENKIKQKILGLILTECDGFDHANEFYFKIQEYVKVQHFDPKRYHINEEKSEAELELDPNITQKLISILTLPEKSGAQEKEKANQKAYEVLKKFVSQQITTSVDKIVDRFKPLQDFLEKGKFLFKIDNSTPAHTILKDENDQKDTPSQSPAPKVIRIKTTTKTYLELSNVINIHLKDMFIKNLRINLGKIKSSNPHLEALKLIETDIGRFQGMLTDLRFKKTAITQSEAKDLKSVDITIDSKLTDKLITSIPVDEIDALQRKYHYQYVLKDYYTLSNKKIPVEFLTGGMAAAIAGAAIASNVVGVYGVLNSINRLVRTDDLGMAGYMIAMIVSASPFSLNLEDTRKWGDSFLKIMGSPTILASNQKCTCPKTSKSCCCGITGDSVATITSVLAAISGAYFTYVATEGWDTFWRVACPLSALLLTSTTKLTDFQKLMRSFLLKLKLVEKDKALFNKEQAGFYDKQIAILMKGIESGLIRYNHKFKELTDKQRFMFGYEKIDLKIFTHDLNAKLSHCNNSAEVYYALRETFYDLRDLCSYISNFSTFYSSRLNDHKIIWGNAIASENNTLRNRRNVSTLFRERNIDPVIQRSGSVLNLVYKS